MPLRGGAPRLTLGLCSAAGGCTGPPQVIPPTLVSALLSSHWLSLCCMHQMRVQALGCVSAFSACFLQASQPSFLTRMSQPGLEVLP